MSKTLEEAPLWQKIYLTVLGFWQCMGVFVPPDCSETLLWYIADVYLYMAGVAILRSSTADQLEAQPELGMWFPHVESYC